MRPKRILITAGEASADKHAAALVRAFKAEGERVECFGMGGPAMVDAGFEACYAMDDLSVMGFSSVLPKLFKILGVYAGIKRLMREREPDVFIPVDLPDFNMGMAKYAKRRSIKVLYYIAPQAWAWRRARAKTLAKITDGLAVIFPFEEAFFRKAGVNARYVGHPFAETTPMTEVHWPPTRVAMLPGSRWDEIVRMLPVMLAAKRIMAARHPELRFFLPVAPGIDPARIKAMLDADVILTEGLPEADLAMVKSGTACFETALKGIPQVIGYTTSRLNYRLAKTFVRLEQIGMPNIVMGRTVAPELIQDAFTGENVAFLLMRYMDDRDLYFDTRNAFGDMRAALGTHRSAHEVVEWVNALH